MSEFEKKALNQLKQLLAPEMEQILVDHDNLDFLRGSISGEKQFKIIGELSFLPSEKMEQDGYIMDMNLILIQNEELKFQKKLQRKLFVLNQISDYGQFLVNENGQICMNYRYPVLKQMEYVERTTEYVCREMFSFLDGIYPYLLVAATDPDKMTLDEYLTLVKEAEKSD